MVCSRVKETAATGLCNGNVYMHTRKGTSSPRNHLAARTTQSQPLPLVTNFKTNYTILTSDKAGQLGGRSCSGASSRGGNRQWTASGPGDKNNTKNPALPLALAPAVPVEQMDRRHTDRYILRRKGGVIEQKEGQAAF